MALLIGGGGPHAPFLVAILEAISVFLLLDVALLGDYSRIGKGGASALLLIAFVIVVGLIQLIPLPPSVWHGLPGRSLLADALAVQGRSQAFASLSLAPEDTRSSLLSFLPPIAIFAGVLSLGWKDRRLLVWIVLVVSFASTALGLAQVASGDTATLNPYGLPPFGLAVGFFANRNQQAVFLVSSFMFAIGQWLEMTRGGRRVRPLWIAGFLPLVAACCVATASRSGFALLVLATLFGAALWLRRAARRHDGLRARFKRLPKAVRTMSIVGGLIVILLLLLLLSQTYQVERLLTRFEGTATDSRVGIWADVSYVITLYLPAGAGFGAFSRVFEASEPLQSLHFWRVNHAHNDYVELLIECGLAAIPIIAGFILWFGVRMVAAWKKGVELAGGSLMRASGAVILFIMLHSLVEYPLRTEALACLFALACAFLVDPFERETEESPTRTRTRTRSRSRRSSSGGVS